MHAAWCTPLSDLGLAGSSFSFKSQLKSPFFPEASLPTGYPLPCFICFISPHPGFSCFHHLQLPSDIILLIHLFITHPPLKDSVPGRRNLVCIVKSWKSSAKNSNTGTHDPDTHRNPRPMFIEEMNEVSWPWEPHNLVFFAAMVLGSQWPLSSP